MKLSVLKSLHVDIIINQNIALNPFTKHWLIICFLILIGPRAFSQFNAPITVKKVMGAYQYSQTGQPLSLDDLEAIFSENETSTKLFLKAKGRKSMVTLLSGGGMFLVGFALGSSFGKDQINYKTVGVGATLAVISIPINISANKKMIEAVHTYNDHLLSANRPPSRLLLKSAPNSLGLAVCF